MTVVEVIAGTQMLLRGQVTDALTLGGVSAVVTLEYDQGAGFHPLPLPVRTRREGWFAVAARLSDVAARLRIGQALTLRLTATAPGYQPGVLTQGLTAAQFSRQTSVVMVRGVPVPVDKIAAAPVVLTLGLTPRPVMLAGIVLAGNDPAAPVAGARVRITSPGGMTVTTDATGRFRFDAPPLALVLPLRVSKGSRVKLDTHVVSFDTPVNFISLNLPPP